MSTTVQLAFAAFIVTVVTAYMAFLGTTTSWKYYLTVDECLAEAPDLAKQRLRVSGKVAPGSVDIVPGGKRASFKLCGSESELPVASSAPLPDNFVEGMDVVVEGHLDASGRLQGDKVLTRCASKYVADEKKASAVRFAKPVEERRR